MKVTEKCDVYSFGVLALEVIKGKYPSNLAEPLLSSANREGQMLGDMWDDRLEPPTGKILDEVNTILTLAVACLHANPQFRPTMYEVSQIITMPIPHSSNLRLVRHIERENDPNLDLHCIGYRWI